MLKFLDYLFWCKQRWNLDFTLKSIDYRCWYTFTKQFFICCAFILQMETAKRKPLDFFLCVKIMHKIHEFSNASSILIYYTILHFTLFIVVQFFCFAFYFITFNLFKCAFQCACKILRISWFFYIVYVKLSVCVRRKLFISN